MYHQLSAELVHININPLINEFNALIINFNYTNIHRPSLIIFNMQWKFNVANVVCTQSKQSTKKYLMHLQHMAPSDK